MEARKYRYSRRRFLAQAAAMTLSSGLGTAAQAETDRRQTGVFTRQERPGTDQRKPLAALCTVYRPLSDADHILGRFVHGYVKDGGLHVPKHFVQSVYVDQQPDNDLARDLAREGGFRCTRSLPEALTNGPADPGLAGILLIAEHGNYPRNDRGQVLYPRFEMFEKIVAQFRKTGHSIPVFVDRHLSYSWAKARQMVEWSRELHFPLLAGSSLPVSWRMPELELPLDASIEEGLVTAHGGIEDSGFDALEALQTMMERRLGGETGVNSVTCLTGTDVWSAGDKGMWSWDLLEAALARSETIRPGDVRRNVGAFTAGTVPRLPPTAFLIDYCDGSKGTVLFLNGHMQDFCFGARIRDMEARPSCRFHTVQAPGAGHFNCLVDHLDCFFDGGRVPWPVERNLLTTGLLAGLMESRHRRGLTVETPELRLAYSPPAESGFCRRRPEST